MNNIEKKIDALIDALGFDVERVRVGEARCDCNSINSPALDLKKGCLKCQGTGVSHGIFDYKLTKRNFSKPTLHKIVRQYEQGKISYDEMRVSLMEEGNENI